MRFYKLCIIICLCAAFVPFWKQSPKKSVEPMNFPGWPEKFDGKTLKPLSFSFREMAFFREFPGRVARFSDGNREIILQWVTVRTRRLHPSIDCFRGLGFHIEPLPIHSDAVHQLWSSFKANKNTEHLIILERMYDMKGQSWPDVYSWYWSALLGTTNPPWWKITIAMLDKEGQFNMLKNSSNYSVTSYE